MLERLDRYWRVVATGFCFTVFGLGGLIIRCTVPPLLMLLVRSPKQRKSIVQAVIHHCFRYFVGLMRILQVLTYEVRYPERLQRSGMLVLANHPSLIDVVFLIAFIPRADCIVKASLLRNPFTRGPIKAAGFICNNGGAQLVNDCSDSLAAGNNLIIFPEGTRTPLKGRIKLQRGAAHVAIHSRLNITPVHIDVSLPMLPKGQPWWKVPQRRPHFIFEVREDICIKSICCVDGNASQAARQITDYLSDFLFKGPARVST